MGEVAGGGCLLEGGLLLLEMGRASAAVGLGVSGRCLLGSRLGAGVVGVVHLVDDLLGAGCYRVK